MKHQKYRMEQGKIMEEELDMVKVFMKNVIASRAHSQ